MIVGFDTGEHTLTHREIDTADDTDDRAAVVDFQTNHLRDSFCFDAKVVIAGRHTDERLRSGGLRRDTCRGSGHASGDGEQSN